jgi:hypothetical protein
MCILLANNFLSGLIGIISYYRNCVISGIRQFVEFIVVNYFSILFNVVELLLYALTSIHLPILMSNCLYFMYLLLILMW